MRIHVYKNHQTWYLKTLKVMTLGLVNLNKHDCIVLQKTESLDDNDYEMFDEFRALGYEIEAHNA